MQVVLLLLMLLVARGFYDTSATDEFDRYEQQASTLVQMMEYYHGTVLEFCRELPNYCQGGVIYPDQADRFRRYDTTPYYAYLYGQDFVSFIDPMTRTLVTLYNPPWNASRSFLYAEDPTAFYGAMGRILKQTSDHSMFAGQWSAATQTIGNGVSVSSSSGTTNPQVSVPQNSVGIMFSDGQPMLATRLP